MSVLANVFFSHSRKALTLPHAAYTAYVGLRILSHVLEVDVGTLDYLVARATCSDLYLR